MNKIEIAGLVGAALGFFIGVFTTTFIVTLLF